MDKPAIGFIGLGLMGSAMVERLQALGYGVTVMAHRSRPNIDAAVARGAVEVATARELAAASDIVMLCVDTSASVEGLMRGPDGVLAGLKQGALVIDFGTSLPGSTRALAKETAAAGGAYMDAPLGRTPADALKGRLNIMAAGAEEDFDRARPVLEDLGENVFHVGPVGAGHTLKLINNFYGMTTACAMSEAFAMADLAGLPRDRLYAVMSAGPLNSGMMGFVAANAIEGDPNKLEFSIANARKDVGYYAAMADELGVPSIMSQAPKTALGLAGAEGYSDKRVSQMVDWFAGLFGGRR
ncbi:MAG: NAD(P)-dependent oxidoreductase [Alphaproteobacteria bacterium]|nr:MAG: NAD(P)-dependent oxidoreductase [Alphaproteobacteria bacterium]